MHRTCPSTGPSWAMMTGLPCKGRGGHEHPVYYYLDDWNEAATYCWHTRGRNDRRMHHRDWLRSCRSRPLCWGPSLVWARWCIWSRQRYGLKCSVRACIPVFSNSLCREVTVPVLAAVNTDNMLCGVQEPFATIRPVWGARCRIGIKFYPEAQTLALFNISLDWTWIT